MHSTIFNFLLVALAVVSVEAAPHPEDIVGLLPEVAPRSAKPIDDTVLSKPKTRRMVYGWSPKSFEDDHEGADESDLALLSADPAETSEHPPRDKKKISGTNKTQTASKDQVPPPEVLKTLCGYFLSGHPSKNGTAGNAYPPAQTAPISKGNDKDPWYPSADWPSKNNSSLTDTPSNTTAVSQKTGLSNGAGNKSSLAITWCHQQSFKYLSSDSPTHHNSTFNEKPPSHKNGTVPLPDLPPSPSQDLQSSPDKGAPPTQKLY